MTQTEPTFATLSRVFFDADAARDYLEAIRWPNGPVCPHCDGEDAYKLTPKPGSKRPVRPGVYKCRSCRKQFTVTVGTIFEQTRVPLNKWLYLIHLVTCAKKGVSAHQVHRTLGVTYKTAWFMCHRVWKAMELEPLAGLLSGVVEADETHVGGKKGGGGQGGPTAGGNKCIVFGMVERNGEAWMQVVADVTDDNLQGVITDEVKPDSHLMMDGLLSYRGLDQAFAGHSWVDHDSGGRSTAASDPRRLSPRSMPWLC